MNTGERDKPTLRQVRRWKVVLSVALTSFAIHFANGTTHAQVVSQAQYQAQYQQVGQIDNALRAWSNYLSTNNLYSYLYSYPGLAQRYATDPNYKAQYDNWVYQTQVQGIQYMQQLQVQRAQLINTMQAEVATAQAAQNAAQGNAAAAYNPSGYGALSGQSAAQTNPNTSGNNAGVAPGASSNGDCSNNHIQLLGLCAKANSDKH
jgi:hypothetical protein